VPVIVLAVEEKKIKKVNGKALNRQITTVELKDGENSRKEAKTSK